MKNNEERRFQSIILMVAGYFLHHYFHAAFLLKLNLLRFLRFFRQLSLLLICVTYRFKRSFSPFFTYTSSSQTCSSQNHVVSSPRLQGTLQYFWKLCAGDTDLRIKPSNKWTMDWKTIIPSGSIDNTLFSCTSFMQFCSTSLIENHF